VAACRDCNGLAMATFTNNESITEILITIYRINDQKNTTMKNNDQLAHILLENIDNKFNDNKKDEAQALVFSFARAPLIS
jgi:hypothetical protein